MNRLELYCRYSAYEGWARLIVSHGFDGVNEYLVVLPFVALENKNWRDNRTSPTMKIMPFLNG